MALRFLSQPEKVWFVITILLGISVKSEDIAKVMVHNISNTPDKNIFTNTDIFERAKDISI